jgi:hypothetical protein
LPFIYGETRAMPVFFPITLGARRRPLAMRDMAAAKFIR